jgi:coenzyme PQQ precursor peptide PqqA
MRHEACLKRGRQTTNSLEAPMRWTKPEAEIVAVTMEVTAYVATL